MSLVTCLNDANTAVMKHFYETPCLTNTAKQ